MLCLQVRIQDLANQNARMHTFFTSPVHVGRNELNELSLPQPYVSMWHGIIRFDERSIEYVDLGSTNGTTVKGERLPTSVPVKIEASTTLQIGSLQVQLSLGQAEPEAGAGRTKTQFGMRAVAEPGPNRSSVVRSLDARPGAPFPAGAASAALPPLPAVASGPPGSSVQDLFAAYLDYRKAYVRLHTGVTERITALPQEQRQQEVSRLVSRFPALRQEQPFHELLSSLSIVAPGAPPVPSSASQSVLPPGQLPPTPSEWKKLPPPVPSSLGPGEPDAREAPFAALLGEFARCYLPSGAQLVVGSDAEKFLERLSEVLETFGKAFLELKKGQQQFGEEMAVRTTADPGQIHSMQSAKDVLAYVLDFRLEDGTRIQELTRGFADVMIHQVALINGVKAGVRAMLERLSPEGVARELGRIKISWHGMPLPSGIWPFQSYARWRRYGELHREFSEEEQAMSAVVFGREFARAYAVVTGQQTTSSEAENKAPRLRRELDATPKER